MGLGRFGGLLLTLGVVSLAAGGATAQERCKGTKQFYAGKCRYPDEVNRLKAAAAAQRQAQAERLAKEEEQKQRELQAQRDAGACDMARSTDTREGWEAYLKAHPEGPCVGEANERLAALPETPPPPPPEEAPPPPPTTPPPAPKPPTTPPDGPAGVDDGGLSPLTIIGLAVGGAGVVTWAVAGGISLSRSADLDEQCPDDLCPVSSEGELDKAMLAAHVTTVGAVVTGVGVSLSVIGLLTSGSDAAEAPAAATIEPTVGFGTLGVRGSF
ncbi:MAG: hypothetical protein JRI68_16715 [Deltaproteobacteria bacterium]|nr:hypothetical protein [Deltaproteobacteria bacterium]